MIPQPVMIDRGPGQYVLPGHLEIAICGAKSDRLSRAIERWIGYLYKIHDVSLTQAHVDEDAPAAIRFHIESTSEYPLPDSDESYELKVSSDGVVIRAGSWLGGLRALSTLLLQCRMCGGSPCLPYLSVKDSPRYSWRGLLLDTVRHWIPIDVIKQQLDGMELAKLNVLHLHFTDDQSFRVESLSFPKLHKVGSDGRYYLQSEIRGLVEYAADRGIRVVPEFGLPGHSRSWQIAYPELAIDPDLRQKLYAAPVFSPPVDPTRESTYQFIRTLMAEMLPLFPDPYVHMGGDEVKLAALEESQSVQSYMTDHGIEKPADLIARFSLRYANILREMGKTPIGWDEVLHPDLPDDVVVHLWRSTNSKPEIQSHPILLSTNYYLDHVRSAQSHYSNDPTNLRVAGKPSEDLASNLLGVEIAAWSEMHDENNLHAVVWPRSLAIAEQLWSTQECTQRTYTEDLYYRMERASAVLQSLGVIPDQEDMAPFLALAEEGDAVALQALASVCEPTFLYPTRHWRFALQYVKPELFGYINNEPLRLSPFTKTLAYESQQAHRFRQLVDRFVQHPVEGDVAREIMSTLRSWYELDSSLRATIENSEGLRRVHLRPLTKGLKQLSAVGMALVELHCAGSCPTLYQRWRYSRVISRYRRLQVSYTRKYLLHSLRLVFLERPVLAQNYLAIQPGIETLCREFAS